MSEKKPDFFIAGAARCGTTALWYCLKENPGVFMPKEMLLKEPAFFSGLKKSRFNKWADYSELFSAADASHRRVGEASTAYLTDEESPGRIHDYDRDAKIIISLRNPVSRAYSLYNWMVQDGYEYAGTFEEALKLEEMRAHKKIPNYFEPEYYHNYMYFHSGLYYAQVKRYIDLFKKNVLLVKFDNFIKNFEVEYERICGFLGVEAGPPRQIPKNESFAVISPQVQFLLRKLTTFYLSGGIRPGETGNNKDEADFRGKLHLEITKQIDSLQEVVHTGMFGRFKLFRRLKKITRDFHTAGLQVNWDSKEIRDALLKYGLQNHPPGKINEETAARLKEKYKPDIRKLCDYSGMDFTDWIQ